MQKHARDVYAYVSTQRHSKEMGIENSNPATPNSPKRPIGSKTPTRLSKYPIVDYRSQEKDNANA
jgi:hypothetical protein